MKSIVLFKNGDIGQYKEKQLTTLLESRCHKIKLIMVPLLDSEAPLYIPIKPTRFWLFDKAEVRFATAVYSFNLDREEETPDTVIDISKKLKAKSIIELANILNYAYKVRGYSVKTCECEEAYPTEMVNVITINGIHIRLKDKNGEVIYDENRFIDHEHRTVEFLQDLSMATLIRGMDEMLDKFDNLDDFIYMMRSAVYKRSRHWNYIQIHEGKWSKKDRWKSDRLMLFGIGAFNNYLLIKGSDAEYYHQFGELTISLQSVYVDREFDAYIGEKWDSSAKPAIANALMNDPYAIPFYETFTMYANCAEDLFSFVFYLDVYLTYARYVLYGAIFNGEGNINDFHTFVSFCNPEALDIRRPDYMAYIVLDIEHPSLKKSFDELTRIAGPS